MNDHTSLDITRLKRKVERLEYVVRQLVSLLKCDSTGRDTQLDCDCHACSSYKIAVHNFETSYYE